VPKLSPALDRIPPQAVEAEQAVIGCCLIDPPSIQVAREILSTADLYRDSHRPVLRAIYELHRNSEPVDILTVALRLEQYGALDIAGGRAYLMACVDAVPAASRCAAYAIRVRQAATRRALIDAAGKIHGLAYDEGQELPAVLGASEELLRSVNGGGGPLGLETVTAAELGKKQFAPMRWAIPDLVPEGLTLLVGRGKTGKSFLLHAFGAGIAAGGTVLSHYAVEQGDALYLALEDPERRLQDRHRQLMRADCWPEGLHFATHAPTLDQGLIWQIERWLTEHPNARVVMIDTLAKIRRPDEGKNGSGNAYLSDYQVGAELQGLATRRRIGVVVSHHTNKMQMAVDESDTISGTRGIEGSVDGWIILERKRGDPEAVLAVTHREFAGRRIKIRWDDAEGWGYIGDADAIARNDSEAEILEVLLRWRRPMLAAEIAKELGANRKTVGNRMRDMALRHLLTHGDSGMFGLPGWGPHGADGIVKQLQETDHCE